MNLFSHNSSFFPLSATAYESSGHVSVVRREGPRRGDGNDDGRVPPPGGVPAHQLHPEVLHAVAFPIPGVAPHGGGRPADL